MAICILYVCQISKTLKHNYHGHAIAYIKITQHNFRIIRSSAIYADVTAVVIGWVSIHNRCLSTKCVGLLIAIESYQNEFTVTKLFNTYHQT